MRNPAGRYLPVALLDGRQLNLSTIRCITQVAVKRLERLQKALKRFCVRLYRFIVPIFIREGFLPFHPKWEACEFLAPPPPVMDPMIALQEARGKVDARFASPSRVMQETYGVNKDTEDEQTAQDLEDWKEKGIEPVAAPGSGSPPGGVAGGDSGNTDSNAEDAKGAEDKKKDRNTE